MCVCGGLLNRPLVVCSSRLGVVLLLQDPGAVVLRGYISLANVSVGLEHRGQAPRFTLTYAIIWNV